MAATASQVTALNTFLVAFRKKYPLREYATLNWNATTMDKEATKLASVGAANYEKGLMDAIKPKEQVKAAVTPTPVNTTVAIVETKPNVVKPVETVKPVVQTVATPQQVKLLQDYLIEFRKNFPARAYATMNWGDAVLSKEALTFVAKGKANYEKGLIDVIKPQEPVKAVPALTVPINDKYGSQPQPEGLWLTSAPKTTTPTKTNEITPVKTVASPAVTTIQTVIPATPVKPTATATQQVSPVPAALTTSSTGNVNTTPQPALTITTDAKFNAFIDQSKKDLPRRAWGIEANKTNIYSIYRTKGEQAARQEIVKIEVKPLDSDILALKTLLASFATKHPERAYAVVDWKLPALSKEALVLVEKGAQAYEKGLLESIKPQVMVKPTVIPSPTVNTSNPVIIPSTPAVQPSPTVANPSQPVAPVQPNSTVSNPAGTQTPSVLENAANAQELYENGVITKEQAIQAATNGIQNLSPETQQVIQTNLTERQETANNLVQQGVTTAAELQALYSKQANAQPLTEREQQLEQALQPKSNNTGLLVLAGLGIAGFLFLRKK